MTTTYNPGDTVTLDYWDGPRPYVIPADAVAVIVDALGGVQDVALNWETNHVAAVRSIQECDGFLQYRAA